MDNSKKRDFIFFLSIFFVSIWIILKLSNIVIPIAFSFIIAYILDPVIDYFEDKKVSRTITIFSLFGVLLTLLIIGIFWLFPILIDEINKLQSKLPDYISKVHKLFYDSLTKIKALKDHPDIWLKFEEYSQNLVSFFPVIFKTLSKSLWSLSSNVLGTIAFFIGLSIIPVYIFYFLRDIDIMMEKWPMLLPSGVRKEVVSVVREINQVIVAFFRGQLLVALFVGVMNSIGFLIVGVDFAILLGMSIGFLNLIPYVGISLGFIPALLLAYLKFHDWQHILGVAMVLIIVQMIEGTVVSPKIMGEKVGLHPLVIVISLLAWGTLLGFIGILLAIPLTCIIFILYRRYILRLS